MSADGISVLADELDRLAEEFDDRRPGRSIYYWWSNGSALLAEALKLGAFTGPEYTLLRQRIERSIQDHALRHAAVWLREREAALPVRLPPMTYAPHGPSDACTTGETGNNCRAFALLLRHEAKKQPQVSGKRSGEEEAWPRLDDDRRTVIFPDGAIEWLEPDQYRVVARLVEARGLWRSQDQLRCKPGSSERIGYIIDGRPGRNSKQRTGGLPSRIRKHIEPGGPKGWRWITCAHE